MLDGVDGVLYLADYHFNEVEGYELSDFDYKLSEVEERDGEETVWQELRAKCAGSISRSAWLEKLETYRVEHKKMIANRTSGPRQSYEELRQRIAEKGRRVLNSHSWARRALKVELEQAARDILNENDPEWLIPLLRVFMDTPFPLDPTKLFEWAKSEEEYLSYAAKDTLANLKLSAVHALALDLIEKRETLDLAVKMLNTNYEEDDESLVSAVLQYPVEPVEYHRLATDARYFEKAHPTELSAKIIETLYENNPCSMCREQHVERLIELEALPDWIREEAAFDSYDETRKLIKPHKTY